jgi:hypothetical protein
MHNIQQQVVVNDMYDDEADRGSWQSTERMNTDDANLKEDTS